MKEVGRGVLGDDATYTASVFCPSTSSEEQSEPNLEELSIHSPLIPPPDISSTKSQTIANALDRSSR